MWDTFLKVFIPLFVAFDVVGVLPIYAAFASGLDADKRAMVLRDSIATAFFVAGGFALLGQRILAYLGITIGDFYIAGGIILFGLAGREILGGGRVEAAGHEDLFAVVPLGVPLLAGPAVLTTTLILYATFGLVYVLASLALNLFICWIAFKYSVLLVRFVSRRWLEVLSKVVVLLLAGIAIMFIRTGLESWYLPGAMPHK
jgi:multiple antibiotic resistance protein